MKIKRIGNWMFVGAKRDFHRVAIKNGAAVGFYRTPGYARRKFSAYAKFGAYLLQIYPATLDIRS